MLDLLFRLVALIATVKPTFSSFLKTNLSLSLSLSISISPAGEEARDDGIWKAGGIEMMGRDARPDLGGFLVRSGFGSGLWTAWFSGWISQTHAGVRGFLPDLSRAQSPPVHGLRKWTLGGDCLGGGDADVVQGGGAGWFVFRVVWVGGSGAPILPEKKTKKTQKIKMRISFWV
jgi:hypothetical protein